MTTDRELLELAAKAAGIECEIEEFSNGRCIGTNQYNEIVFDPLTDDGDALRLAVKLYLELDVCHTGVAVRTPNGNKVLLHAKQEPDHYAATRRAIVRAAAEIGRNMT